MADDTNAVLHQLALGLEDLRKRMGRMEGMVATTSSDISKLNGQMVEMKTEFNQAKEELTEVAKLNAQMVEMKTEFDKTKRELTEVAKAVQPVIDAYKDVPKYMKGFVIAGGLCVSFLTAWLTGGLGWFIRTISDHPMK